MKMLSTLSLGGALLVLAGCVTEGGLNIEPASEEEQAQANLDAGVGYLREDRPDIAIERLSRALELDSRLVEAHSAIAIAYDQTGESELAERHHMRASQLAPQDPVPQNAFAVFLCRQNRWKEAEPYFERAIADSTNLARVSYLMNAATCARAGGDLASAETFCRSALGVNTASADALRCLVDVSIQQQEYLQGRAFWQRLEQSAPLQAGDLLSCYVIETGNGDTATAGDCAGRLRREFPGSPVLRQLSQLEQNGG